jgi:hypothetical protein
VIDTGCTTVLEVDPIDKREQVRFTHGEGRSERGDSVGMYESAVNRQSSTDCWTRWTDLDKIASLNKRLSLITQLGV